jgi:hypothetical protein
MPKKTKALDKTVVFLSSTFRDLAPDRAILKLALESSGYQVLGMELFTASPDPPLATCLAELDRSHIYVGIIGECFGSCPLGYKKSYTQLEYEHAIKRKMPIFCFLTANDAELTPAQFEQDGNKRERLKAFRKRIERHTVAFFKNANHAAWQILAALRKHEIQIREKKGKK